MYTVSPVYESQYYYEYPSIVQEIKDVASAHGFNGEYEGAEICWNSPDCPWCNTRRYPTDSNIVAAKYYARGIVMHLGMDLTTGTSGLSSLRVESSTTVRNISTLMAGAEPISVSIDIQSTATNIRTYGFYLPDGSKLVALWTDGIAVDDDAGIKSTVTIQNVSAQKVIGIDVLNSFEQPLVFSNEGNNLVIRDLMVKDYPLFLRLIP
jgi:hypothetical protein